MNSGNLVILGSTGSIGQSTLEVVRQNSDRFRVVGLSGNRNLDLLLQQAREFRPTFVAVGEIPPAGFEAQLPQGTILLDGENPLDELCQMPGADIVVAAIVGFAGLRSVLMAIHAEKHVALANKESLVAGGKLVREALKKSRSLIVPVDSEHNSIFQCLQAASSADQIEKIILTASGGPFRLATAEQLKQATPEEALKHPRWSMGQKISIDSATMMNKALEVIEAHWLFDLPLEKISVLIHPQSLVHGLVEFSDGALLAAIADSDMKVPISHALGYLNAADPKHARGGRIASGAKKLDLAVIQKLEFYPPDLQRFPALELAGTAIRVGGTAPCILNAANERAVEAFLARRISFPMITHVVSSVLERSAAKDYDSLSELVEADSWARTEAETVIGKQ